MESPRVFEFPEIVDEVSARLVATGVVGLCLLTLVTRQEWVLVPLALGFVLRVASGPRFSPLALFVTRMLRPRLGVAERLTAGTPKRFAQGIGATLAVASVVAGFGFGSWSLSWALVAMILVAASLEAAFGFCLGCAIFAQLMRLGVVSEAICADCADISQRLARIEAERGLEFGGSPQSFEAVR